MTTRWLPLLILFPALSLRGQDAAPAVVAAKPLVRDASHFDFACTLEAPAAVVVRAPLSGTIDKVLVQAGDEVKSGDVLVEIGTAALRKNLTAAEAEAKLLESTYQAVSAKLLKGKPDDLPRLTAERDLAGVRHRLALAEIDRLRGELALAQVKAPAAGRVDQLEAKAGRYVFGGVSATALATLVRTDVVVGSFEVDQRTLLRSRELLRQVNSPFKDFAELPVRLKLDGELDYQHPGKLTLVERQADPKTGLVKCYVEFANPKGALAAVVLEKKKRNAAVRVTAGDSKPILLVIEPALLITPAGEPYLLVVGAKDIVEIRPVKLGPPREGLAAIDEGLKPEDWVVLCVDRLKQDPKAKLSPKDIATDIRLTRVRPGMAVQPLRVEMEAALRHLKKTQ